MTKYDKIQNKNTNASNVVYDTCTQVRRKKNKQRQYAYKYTCFYDQHYVIASTLFLLLKATFDRNENKIKLRVFFL
jgi:hypothetical protein